MYKNLLYIGLLMALIGLSGKAVAEISEETLEREHRSRYHINYASYLIDIGKYLEALENYQAAEEVTTTDKTKIDALLAKATLLSSFLDAPEEALNVYRHLREDYQHAAEISQYREGMLLFELNRFTQAQQVLKSYLETYPSGRFQFQTDTLLREASKASRKDSSQNQVSKPSNPQVTPIVPKTPKSPGTDKSSDPKMAPDAPKKRDPLQAQKPSDPQVTPAVPKTPKSPGTDKPSDPKMAPDAPKKRDPLQAQKPSDPQVTPAVPKTPKSPGTTKPSDRQMVPGVPKIPSPPAVPTVPVAVPSISPVAVSSDKKKRPEKQSNPHLRVRMCRTTKQAHIQGTQICVEAMGCKDRYTLGLKSGAISVDGHQSSKKTLEFKSDQPLTIICGKKKKKVRGILKARIHKGKLLINNIVDIEDYLLSVVPSENPASWPVESLKAQAVAARTYAYYQLQHRKNWAYDLVDYAGDQAYEGMKKEHRRSTTAVKATDGEVLMYKGKPILAMYSANSGGYTADSKAVFNLHKPYLVAQRDPASLNGGMANWTRKFKVSKVIAELKKMRIDAKGLRAIEAYERGPSGRIVKVRLVLKNGKTKVLRNRTTLRRALDLPEILHKIRLDNNTFIFEGHGWGHGVGYSQWGSAYLGKKKKYREILSFYYGAAKIEQLW